MLRFYPDEAFTPGDTESKTVDGSGGRGGRMSPGADSYSSLGFVSSGESDRGEPGSDANVNEASRDTGNSDSNGATTGSGEVNLKNLVATDESLGEMQLLYWHWR
ncbi:hypothetical protein PHYPSEUDO_000940 [Phytophthora pseudosyringae]|uniref:Uncharacterized protein n=1 Tax=Phytophthora pseudosyringae TaxID=221518 RepID=A0A8T1W041_9STRA|nr:hypothetical protein PHYPSEUDO_000940 [Phytophthora pseudosyringae]